MSSNLAEQDESSFYVPTQLSKEYRYRVEMSKNFLNITVSLKVNIYTAVSYTHLTLPTKRIV